MGKVNISRSTISTRKKNEINVTIKNSNEVNKRQFQIKAYDQESETKEALPILLGEKQVKSDQLDPEQSKNYKVKVSNVPKKVVLEITQINGGSGIKVSNNNKKSKIEMQLK